MPWLAFSAKITSHPKAWGIYHLYRVLSGAGGGGEHEAGKTRTAI